MKQLKILITTDLYTVKTNGVVTSVTNLTEELRRKGHDVRILTLSKDSVSRVEDNVYYIGSFSMNKVYPGVRGTLRLRSHILHELIEWGPDIIHSQCEFFTFQFAKSIAKHCHAPLVHTYHTLYEDYVGYVGMPDGAKRQLVKTLSKYRLHSAKTVIAPSEKVFSILKDYGMDQDIQVIPSGISIEKHLEPYSLPMKQELRRKLGIAEDSFVLLSLGRLGKEKNIEEILRCMTLLTVEHPDTVLLIVGDGPDRTELQDRTRDLQLQDHVIFTGAVPPEEVHGYYQIADVFVSASTSETQGLVFVEAAANGLPLICHKDPCLQGILCDKENGFSYETEDEFEQAFMHCLNNEGFREAASKASRDNALKFGKEHFADRIEDVYLSLLTS